MLIWRTGGRVDYANCGNLNAVVGIPYTVLADWHYSENVKYYK